MEEDKIEETVIEPEVVETPEVVEILEEETTEEKPVETVIEPEVVVETPVKLSKEQTELLKKFETLTSGSSTPIYSKYKDKIKKSSRP